MYHKVRICARRWNLAGESLNTYVRTIYAYQSGPGQKVRLIRRNLSDIGAKLDIHKPEIREIIMKKMVKTRVGVRLKDAVQRGKKSHNKSEDLARLTQRYDVFSKNLRALIAALKGNFASMQQLARTRQEVRP